MYGTLRSWSCVRGFLYCQPPPRFFPLPRPVQDPGQGARLWRPEEDIVGALRSNGAAGAPQCPQDGRNARDRRHGVCECVRACLAHYTTRAGKHARGALRRGKQVWRAKWRAASPIMCGWARRHGTVLCQRVSAAPSRQEQRVTTLKQQLQESLFKSMANLNKPARPSTKPQHNLPVEATMPSFQIVCTGMRAGTQAVSITRSDRAP